ncbi:Myotubularin-like phosphatase domain [Balamuthia mandrillaris]
MSSNKEESKPQPKGGGGGGGGGGVKKLFGRVGRRNSKDSSTSKQNSFSRRKTITISSREDELLPPPQSEEEASSVSLSVSSDQHATASSRRKSLGRNKPPPPKLLSKGSEVSTSSSALDVSGFAKSFLLSNRSSSKDKDKDKDSRASKEKDKGGSTSGEKRTKTKKLMHRGKSVTHEQLLQHTRSSASSSSSDPRSAASSSASSVSYSAFEEIIQREKRENGENGGEEHDGLGGSRNEFLSSLLLLEEEEEELLVERKQPPHPKFDESWFQEVLNGLRQKEEEKEEEVEKEENEKRRRQRKTAKREEVLDLSNCYLDDFAAAQLAEALASNNTVIEIDLQSNLIGDEGLALICRMLRTNRTLTSLNLLHNSFTRRGMARLLASLYRNLFITEVFVDEELTSFDTCEFAITPSVEAKLEQVLKQNNDLRNVMEGEADELDLSEREHAAIHPDIVTRLHKFKHVTSIQYERNRLASLPPCIGQFTSLQRLCLSFNNLERLPHELGNCKTLLTLDLRGNQIVEFPASLCSLPKLKRITFSSNRLQSIPQMALGSMPSLTFLDVSDNPLSEMSETFKNIAQTGGKDTVSYLKELAKGSEDIFRMKLMFVGDENVGKTSLLRNLLLKHKSKTQATAANAAEAEKEKDKDREAYLNVATDGIDIHRWMVPHPNKALKGSHVVFSCWDFAGQEVYYATHSFFLSGRAMYIVLFNLVNGVEDTSRVEYWLQSIDARSYGTSPVVVVLVGTHCEDKRCTPEYIDSCFQTLTKRFKKRFKKRLNLEATFAISNLSGNGISKLTNYLLDAALKQPYMPQSIPKSYLSLEEKLSGLRLAKRPPLISFEECHEQALLSGIEPSSVNSAVRLLHDLGCLLHFHEDPTLRNLVLLDPQWITSTFATIVTIKQTFIQNGVLRRKNLPQMWREPEHPLHLHHQMLLMLERFEIVARVHGKPSLLLASSAPSLSSSSSSLSSSSSSASGTTATSQEKQPGEKVEQQENEAGSTEVSNNKETKEGEDVRKGPATATTEPNTSLPIINASTMIMDDDGEEELILIPCLLHDKEPEAAVMLKYWPLPIHQAVGRKFYVEFVPNGFFGRLIVRFIASHYTPLVFWHNGIVLQKGNETIKLLLSKAQLSEDIWRVLEQSKRGRRTAAATLLTRPELCLEMWIRGPKPASHLANLVEHIETLLVDWLNLTDRFYVTVPCTHCVTGTEAIAEYNEYSIEELSKQAAMGNQDATMQCRNGTAVSLSKLAPDLFMSEFKSSEIDFKDLVLEKALGKGGYATVYKGTHQGKEVAVKELRMEQSASRNTIDIFKEFRREVALMSELQHSNIVQMEGFCIRSETNSSSSASSSLSSTPSSSSGNVPTTVPLRHSSSSSAGAAEEKKDKDKERDKDSSKKKKKNKKKLSSSSSNASSSSPSMTAVAKTTNSTSTSAPNLSLSSVSPTSSREKKKTRSRSSTSSATSSATKMEGKKDKDNAAATTTTTSLYMILEYMSLGDLYHFIHDEEGRYGKTYLPNWSFVLKLCRDIALGVTFMHRHTPPIIHRDLKTPNVLLGIEEEEESGRPTIVAKVADFGLSRLMLLSDKLALKPVDNPVWLAPELLRNEHYDEKVDVYSVGVIMYEIVSGQDYMSHVPAPPHRSVITWIEDKILDGTRPPLPRRCEEEMPALADLIRKCWAESPEERPSIAQVSRSLSELYAKRRKAFAAELASIPIEPLVKKKQKPTTPTTTTTSAAKAVEGRKRGHTHTAATTTTIRKDEGERRVGKKEGKEEKKIQRHSGRRNLTGLVVDNNNSSNNNNNNKSSGSTKEERQHTTT